jgi:hypothetical protein
MDPSKEFVDTLRSENIRREQSDMLQPVSGEIDQFDVPDGYINDGYIVDVEEDQYFFGYSGLPSKSVTDKEADKNRKKRTNNRSKKKNGDITNAINEHGNISLYM